MEEKNLNPQSAKSGRGKNDDIASMAMKLFEKVKDIKHENPEITRKIDRLELDVREKLIEIKKCINQLNKKDKEVVTILVIQGIHRTCEEVLID